MTRSAGEPRSGITRREYTVFALVLAVSALGAALRLAGAPATVVFAVAGVAVAGLAYVLGEATDQAGESAGPRLAALMNATFGNLPELIIVILTLREGLVDVARASLVGSVLGNVLLILGFSIFVGGLRNGPLRFNGRMAGVNASMLTLAVVALGVPTLFDRLQASVTSEVRSLSYEVAAVMLILYAAYLVHSFQRPEGSGGHEPGGSARWSARESLAVLSLTAVGTGVMSEVLVSAIRPTIEASGIGGTFIGLIIVPIIGNVAEHMAAVRIAWGGNLDFSMGIAFNSGLQVALGVTAIAVFAGAAVGHELSIVFPPLEIALLAAAAVMAGFIAADGEANWLEGLELVGIYTVAAIAFWFL